MSLRNIFIVSKGTKTLLAIVLSVSITAVAFAFFYYRNLNSLEDPRISKAREHLTRYDQLSGGIESFSQFPYLDSADAIFRSFPDYKSSYETGLIRNNKCSAYLMIALYDTAASKAEKENLLELSLKYCDSSITIYRKWISEWSNLNYEEVEEKLKPYMRENDPVFERLNFNKIFDRRIKNVITAQLETPRRLSVSLSNKGTIYRHKMVTDSALAYYRQALSLWPENRVAENNLSVLMGSGTVKPSFIESLFPPDKNRK